MSRADAARGAESARQRDGQLLQVVEARRGVRGAVDRGTLETACPGLPESGMR